MADCAPEQAAWKRNKPTRLRSRIVKAWVITIGLDPTVYGRQLEWREIITPSPLSMQVLGQGSSNVF